MPSTWYISTEVGGSAILKVEVCVRGTLDILSLRFASLLLLSSLRRLILMRANLLRLFLNDCLRVAFTVSASHHMWVDTNTNWNFWVFLSK